MPWCLFQQSRKQFGGKDITAWLPDHRRSRHRPFHNGLPRLISGAERGPQFSEKNLASTSRALISSDLASGKLPASLGAVTGMFGDQPAFVKYVSSTQINLQAPDNAGSGAIATTLTISGGTSAPLTVAGQPILPGLFAPGGYIAGVASAKPGTEIETYGRPRWQALSRLPLAARTLQYNSRAVWRDGEVKS